MTSPRMALILDTETTGLDPKADACIEVGVILYDLLHAAPITSFASLIKHDRNPAYDVNRITLGMLDAPTTPRADFVWKTVTAFAESADVILAHRAEFDRGFVPQSIRDARPWVCTKFHVEWPLGKLGDPLVALALANGVGVVSAHRAMTDADIIARLLTRTHDRLLSDKDNDPLGRMMTEAMRPRRKVQALVSYDDREKAKLAGFAWEADRKRWVAELPDDKIASLPFRVQGVA